LLFPAGQGRNQDGLDGVEAVLDLIEHNAGARFEDLAGYLITSLAGSWG
jgi:hypothetical protein